MQKGAYKFSIADTAFITACNRFNELEVSKDSFAHLWVTPKVKELTRNFLEKVSPFEDLLISVRHRFFLESIKRLAADSRIDGLVVIGAGFTMYPFFFEDLSCFEIDLPQVIDFKSRVLQSKKVDSKNVTRIGLDLEKTEFPKFDFQNPFILIEGISYYVSKSSLKRILSQMPSNSVVGLVTWNPSTQINPIYKKYLDFIRDENSLNMDYTFYSEKNVSDLGYCVLEKQNYPNLLNLYTRSSPITESQIFPEDLYILGPTK